MIKHQDVFNDLARKLLVLIPNISDSAKFAITHVTKIGKPLIFKSSCLHKTKFSL